MVVIKHREEIQPNYYKATCDCGCMFAFADVEFIRHKIFNEPPYIYCPECHCEISKDDGNITVITPEEYLKYKEITDEKRR